MDIKPLIVIIEDDATISRFIRLTLDSQNYDCLEAKTGLEGLSLVMSHNPDIIILDLGLPDMDGIDLISRIKDLSQVKIIVVSARGLERDKVKALDLGADDYLTKPFSVAELLARIRVALRNSIKPDNSPLMQDNIFNVKDLVIDVSKRIVTINGERIHLTPIEFKILELLAQYAGRVLTHRFIIESVWGNMYDSETQSLRVFMANLRRKIESDPAQPQYLMTEIGVGYKMVDE